MRETEEKERKKERREGEHQVNVIFQAGMDMESLPTCSFYFSTLTNSRMASDSLMDIFPDIQSIVIINGPCPSQSSPRRFAISNTTRYLDSLPSSLPVEDISHW
ncbi:hypothetical protein AWENTII_004867 [Aspergillus wentii]